MSINGFNSFQLPINIGVPQGSILGLLLFLIYINDMSRCSTVLKFIHFADDTTVCLDGDDLTQMFEVMNAELRKVDNWCANKLSLNLYKTAFMIYSNKNKNIDIDKRPNNISCSKYKVFRDNY